MRKITRRSLFQMSLACAGGLPALAQNAGPDALTTAATGETIPHPLSKKTYASARAAAPEGMVYVPAGKFTMGEREITHEVWLDGFFLAKYLVTNIEYKAFVDATGHATLPRH